MIDPAETHEAYIVVLDPIYLGSLHGDTLKVIVNGGMSVFYRGIDREPWWNLDKLYYAGLLGVEMTELRRNIERSGLDGFSPGVCDSCQDPLDYKHA